MPSGQPTTLHEVLVDAVGSETWVRFRFVAPQIARNGGTIDYETAAGDLDALCADVALPYLNVHRLMGDVVVIALMDRPVPFGASDPEATQFIEAYKIEAGACVWHST